MHDPKDFNEHYPRGLFPFSTSHGGRPDTDTKESQKSGSVATPGRDKQDDEQEPIDGLAERSAEWNHCAHLPSDRCGTDVVLCC